MHARTVLFLCCSHRKSNVATTCEAELRKGTVQLAEGKFDDALLAFQAALKTLGWAEAGFCGLPWLSPLRLLSSRERNALLCQALTGAARAALLVGRSLEYTCAFAEHALSAARLCDSGAQLALLPVAERTMLDVLLAQSAAHARDAKWQDARSAATSASRHAVDEEALALVRAALGMARSGEFEEVIAKAEKALQQRSWSAAIRHAGAASALALGAVEHERAQQLCNGGKQGAFNEVLGTAHTHLQHLRFAQAETVADGAMRAAFDPPSTALARAVLADARLGLHEAALKEAAVAAAAKDWDRVIDASNRARSHAATETQRAAADARLTQARNAKLDAAQAHLSAAQAHLSAGRWEHAKASALSARLCADRAMDVNAMRAVASLLHSVSALRDAAEKAEPEYINAVDDFIRRRPDYSGEAPTQYACMVSLIATNCPKPAAIPQDAEYVATVLRRHADVFTVAPGGATVRLVRLTPWRGDKDHRVFGELRCTKCNKRWSSAATYCDKKQACQKCNVWVYPYAQRPLDRKVASDDDEDNERRPHDMANCQNMLPSGDGKKRHSQTSTPLAWHILSGAAVLAGLWFLHKAQSQASNTAEQVQTLAAKFAEVDAELKE
eukprot:jgi/Chrpa1/3482/Chrysochromulina_OHIO_Genome00012330-RA